ncbi:glycosyltransferase involved in cell wall biosynthesis [Parabacteroides sp. PFB2-12]|uniref:hypothetical protein n=1 Tax=unclassified Parabacteroides TaxID=2649774 RepID=UPI00247674DB|nr:MULTISPECIES: hypothetical protein [unclassified Parabacteroides]MDH6343474.1 glycosyltransferase involved in cell wall biosynthesis [Parabacteroides sp. PM6-13]MDH6390926.1 glycosyltransferase involved in cell wall biosynthesis [Parabacteroides sp. PFB2-12]
MSKVFFIYDVGPQSRLEWLASAFKKEDTVWIPMRYNRKNRIHAWRKPLHFLCYIELAIKSIWKSKKEDTIISWNFIPGAFIGVLCRLFRLNRTVLSLNMISHPKGGVIATIRKKVYNYAFAYKKFLFTVNSAETLETYLKEYKIDTQRVSVLPDAYLPIYKNQDFNTGKGYIFCGGEAQRDWVTFFAAAKELPEYSFVGVARKKYMPHPIEIPTNVKMYYDIDEQDFNRLLEESAIVALPLLSTLPAGLIVIFKSIFLSKPLIVTRTSSVENYVQDRKSAILIDLQSTEQLVTGIRSLKTDLDRAKEQTEQAKKNIVNYSPENYSKKIFRILI